MLRQILTSGLALAGFSCAIAQDSTEKTAKPIITGFADAYYRYDFYKMASNNKTSFTNSHNSFELGMASVKLEHSIGKVGMVADLGFGKRAEEFSYNDEASRFSIKQLYLTYSPVTNLKFTAGSWATHVGYELVDPYLNRNYSMSYMFSYGPFFHTGVKADLTLGKHSFLLGVTNPTDFKSTTSKFKYVVGQYSTSAADGKLKAYLNYQGGKSSDTTNNKQVDLVLTQTVSDKFSIGYNGTVAMFKMEPKGKISTATQWWGSAAYLNYDPVPKLGLTLRSEYFSDEDMSTGVFSSAAKGGKIFANTLSANIRISALTIIPELRYENATEEAFTKSSGQATKSAGSFLLAAVYKF
ncbi:MAG: porin [Segetibacter sp.]|nr:porin [Segetibacter sp.]